MLGLTSRLENIIQGLRVHEVGLSKAYRRLICIRVLLCKTVTSSRCRNRLIWVPASSTQVLAPFFTFVAFVINANRTGANLTTAAAFTALSLIALLSDPVTVVIRAIPMIKSAAACFERIQKYLESDVRNDHRLQRSAAGSISEDFTWRPRSTTDHEHEMTRLNAPSATNSRMELLSVRDASFGWAKDCVPTVSECNLIVDRGEVIFLLGPVGSGKTTFLKGILGEVPSTAGFVHTAHNLVGYADQTPWIQNGTIQDNITGCSRMDQAWYEKVIFACALDVDIANLPQGSSTLVGSSGIGLSGGQKQRIAMARAVYANHDLLIFDDVTSGLDSKTEDLVLDRLIGKGGLLRSGRQSLLFATHAGKRLLVPNCLH